MDILQESFEEMSLEDNSLTKAFNKLSINDFDEDYYRQLAVTDECNFVSKELGSVNFYDEFERPEKVKYINSQLYDTKERKFKTTYIERIHNKQRLDNYMASLIIRFSKLRDDMKNDKKFKEFIYHQSNRCGINPWLTNELKKYYTLYCMHM